MFILQFYRWIIWGQPGSVIAEPLGEVVETEHYRFEVIPTPGHCPEHICLFEREQGWLFSGDLFIHERVRYLRTDEDVHTTMESPRRAQDRSLRRAQCIVCTSPSTTSASNVR